MHDKTVISSTRGVAVQMNGVDAHDQLIQRLHTVDCSGAFTDLGGSSCMVKNKGKGRKMTGFQRHQKIVVLMDILKPSQTSMAE